MTSMTVESISRLPGAVDNLLAAEVKVRYGTGRTEFFSMKNEGIVVSFYRSKRSILKYVVSSVPYPEEWERAGAEFIEPVEDYQEIRDDYDHELRPVFMVLADLTLGKTDPEAMKDKYIGRTIS